MEGGFSQWSEQVTIITLLDVLVKINFSTKENILPTTYNK
jgi:hypothetical protein